MPTPCVMPDRMRETMISVEHIVVINAVDPAGDPDVGSPIDIVEVAVIDSRRSVGSGAAGKVNGAVVPDKVGLYVRKRDPCQPERLCRVKRDYDEPTQVRTVVGVVLNDSIVGNNRVTRPCATYRRLPLKRDPFINVDRSHPMKCACWQRDRVAVHRLGIVNGLNVRCRTIGMVDRGFGV